LRFSAPAYADANKDLTTLVDDVWAKTLQEAPVLRERAGRE